MIYLLVLVIAVIAGGVVMALVIKNNPDKAKKVDDFVDTLKK